MTLLALRLVSLWKNFINRYLNMPSVLCLTGNAFSSFLPPAHPVRPASKNFKKLPTQKMLTFLAFTVAEDITTFFPFPWLAAADKAIPIKRKSAALLLFTLIYAVNLLKMIFIISKSFIPKFKPATTFVIKGGRPKCKPHLLTIFQSTP